MKTAVCYYSRHHGNTLKVLEAMAREGEIDLIDVTARQTVRLEDYDCIGFALGVYFGSGIAKGRPNERDLENARRFYREIRETYDRGAHI